MKQDYENGGGITNIKPAIIIDMSKVYEEWREETKGMTDLERQPKQITYETIYRRTSKKFIK